MGIIIVVKGVNCCRWAYSIFVDKFKIIAKDLILIVFGKRVREGKFRKRFMQGRLPILPGFIELVLA